MANRHPATRVWHVGGKGSSKSAPLQAKREAVFWTHRETGEAVYTDLAEDMKTTPEDVAMWLRAEGIR